MPETVAALFDSLALAAVAGEIRACLGARFAGVRQPSPDTITIALAPDRTVRHLLGCIHPQRSRVHFAPRPEATERLSPFGTLIRSRLAEARLSAVEQPRFNRVLRLGFDALEGRVWFVAEVMGRHSNLILADDRVVLGALKVVSAEMSPRRPVLPGRPYLVPPADRPTPDALALEALRGLLESPLPLARRLSQTVLGISPTMAREIAARAGAEAERPAEAAAGAAAAILGVLREIGATLDSGAFAPTFYTEETRAAAFAPFPMRIFARWTAHPTATMSEAVDRFSRDAAGASPIEERRAQLAASVGAALRKRGAALDQNRRALAEAEAAERYRVMGDLILTYARNARPRDVALRVPDHTAGGAEIEIPLDPALTPSENAQRYFRRYAKARAAARAIPARIGQLEAEARALRAALVQIEAAGSSDDLWEIRSDLTVAGSAGRAPRGRPPVRSGPRRYLTADGATILVGRSARENDRITFHEAGPDDLWFHARGLAGAHVVLKAGGRPAESSITAAAQAAAYYSEGRHDAQVAVDCVPRKRVHKPRGAAPGAVTYSEERTLRVAPALPSEEAGGSERLRGGGKRGRG
jgi:predicted ribosome quality control (RQC) complex YloA/Tae2 family protein